MNRLPLHKQQVILHHLVDGCGIRQTSRLCRVSQNSVMKYLRLWGEGAQQLLDDKLQNLTLEHVQFDEIWAFVHAKSANLSPESDRRDRGDHWIFFAQDVASRMIVHHLVGNRNDADTRKFVSGFSQRLRMPTPHESDAHAYQPAGYTPVLQISSDGWLSYPEAIDMAFGPHCKHGVIIKEPERAEYAERRVSRGELDKKTICTSYIERMNLTTRTFMRRLGRKCLCFSKKLENLKAATALHSAYYNLVWSPREFGYKSPARLAGVESGNWRIEELLEAIQTDHR